MKIIIPYFTLQNTYPENVFIAKFLIKYCNLVPRKYWHRQLKMTLDRENHTVKKLKKHNARIFTTLNQFFFPFEAILPRDIFTQNILMQSLPFIFQFISIPSVLYFSVIQVFMMLFSPGSRHTSCKRKIK